MQKLPIGRSDFKTIIEDNYYYIDKTLFIKDVIDQPASVILIPRPRRFGKTLNLTTLRHFFEKTEESNQHLFENLNIWKEKEEYRAKQGKHPVIYLSFKDVKNRNWEEAFENIKGLLYDEFKRHKYLLNDSNLEKTEKKYIEDIISQDASKSDYEKSLKSLSKFLRKYYKQKTVLLIDEYDTPIHAAYHHGYYDEMINFMRNFLSGGLKDNDENLEKSVLTGILRVARESIFSGLNNLLVATIINQDFSDKFGLTEKEVEKIINDFNLAPNFDDVKKWYNGYVFGEEVIYNPWSILNYINRHKEGFRPYWVNTSSNDIVKELIIRGSSALKQDLYALIENKSLRKQITSHTVFDSLKKSDDAIWSFLLFSGYLKAYNVIQQDEDITYEISIPNIEVRYLFKTIIKSWLDESVGSDKVNVLLKALLQKDIDLFHEILQDFMLKVFSYHITDKEEPEKVYQAFLLGLLINLQNEYDVKAERESGYGRYDIMVMHKTDLSKPAILIELKSLRKVKKETLKQAVQSALQQIEDRQYETELQSRGFTNILKLGIAFDGKRVEMAVG